MARHRLGVNVKIVAEILNRAEEFLYKSNGFVIELKINVMRLFHPKDEEEFLYKLKLCQEIKENLDIVDPGLSASRGNYRIFKLPSEFQFMICT